VQEDQVGPLLVVELILVMLVMEDFVEHHNKMVEQVVVV
jgi:hypothetical protein